MSNSETGIIANIRLLTDKVVEIMGEEVRSDVQEVLEDAHRFMQEDNRVKITLADIHLAQLIHCALNLSLDIDECIPKNSMHSPPELPSSSSTILIEQTSPNEKVGPSSSPTIFIEQTSPNEKVSLQNLNAVELSDEMEYCYTILTEICMDEDRLEKNLALHLLSSQKDVQQLLPKLCLFMKHCVDYNVTHYCRLSILRDITRMIEALLTNPFISLENYVNEIANALFLCIVTREIEPGLDRQNHWYLRADAARLMAEVCKKFNTSSNHLESKVVSALNNVLQDNNVCLFTLYGALVALSGLGAELVKVYIIPRIRFISDCIVLHLLDITKNNSDKIAACQIRDVLVKTCTPILISLRDAPDLLDNYKQVSFI